jgi:8-oxo-dGTP pyrophosphatase MutT (NUDIX family)
VDLTEATTRELADLAARYGEPLVVDAPIADDSDDPIRRRDRYGEVCMVVRRPNGKVLLSIKTFYPRGAYRLPTGGIHEGEPVYDALLRETVEETGLETTVERFLARISYRAMTPGSGALFHTGPSSTPSRSSCARPGEPSDRWISRSSSRTGARWKSQSCRASRTRSTTS